MLKKFFKGTGAAVALTTGVMLSGCNVDIDLGDGNGVPLAELDQAGASPSEVVLAGPDAVIVQTGSEFEIEVSGDTRARDALRFELEDDSLAISRAKDADKNIGRATVRVTVPSLQAIVLAGSGAMEATSMDNDAEVTIAGSGTAKVEKLAVNSLELTIAGSGDFETSGTATDMEMTIAGSGSAYMTGLQVDRAEVTIAGSGDAAFASDGTVEASIVGSGDVTVTGSANCTASAMGSGKLRCGGRTAETE